MQEMLRKGILILGTHNVSYAHSDEDIKVLLNVYQEIIPTLTSALNPAVLAKTLACEALEPLFKIR